MKNRVNKKNGLGETMPDYTRQPLLTRKNEDELAAKMEPLWAEGMKGRDIAEELGFGKPGRYEKLMPNYIFYYRLKFNNDPRYAEWNGLFPPRNDPPFTEHRYKKTPKQLKLMSPEVFIQTLNAKLSPESTMFSVKRARAYLILHYWSPLRESEIFERIRENFEITENEIIIHLLRKKKHSHKETDEPIDIPRAFPLVNEVVEWLEDGEWKQKKVKVVTKSGKVKRVLSDRPFHFGKDTANKYVKEVFADHYPHYFRFNFITDGADDPDTTIAELQAKTKLTLAALEEYIITEEKTEDKFDKHKIERLRAKGLVK
jgi:hypothetical protein